MSSEFWGNLDVFWPIFPGYSLDCTLQRCRLVYRSRETLGESLACLHPATPVCRRGHRGLGGAANCGPPELEAKSYFRRSAFPKDSQSVINEENSLVWCWNENGPHRFIIWLLGPQLYLGRCCTPPGQLSAPGFKFLFWLQKITDGGASLLSAPG